MQVINIIGNLTRDPEIRNENTGNEVCNFTVAVNSQKRNPKDGTPVRTATYYRISVWRDQGKNCHKYLTKGRKVSIIGELDVSLARNKDGDLICDQNGSPIINLEVSATYVEFLGGTVTQPETGPAEARKREPAKKEVSAPPVSPRTPGELPL